MPPPSSFRLAPTVLGLLLLATGCAVSPRLPKAPSQGGHWTELTTEHFRVFTDLDDDEGRSAAMDFETELEELRAVAFPGAGQGPRFTIVLFQNDWERWAFRPGVTAGEYLDRPGGELERSPTIVISATRYASEKWFARELFLHELTHRFLAFTYGDVPVWLNEGLAQYLSTMRVEDGKATLGELPYGYRLTRGYTASVGELLGVGRGRFYGGLKETVAGENQRLRYYRGSWAFVHFLQNGPAPIRARFQALMRKLNGGGSLREAWRETLGQVPKAEIEQRFYDYVNADSWTGVELPIHPAVPVPVARIRPLRDEEAHLLWARLADPSLPATDPRSREAQIALAEQAAPGAPEASYFRGSLALERGHEVEASRYFEAALAVAPDEPRYLFGALETFAAEQEWHDAGIEEKGRAWRARLATTARSAEELGMVARILADEGRDADALVAANAAVAADRSSYAAFASRAFVHFHGARYAEAVADQERAMRIASEGVDTESLARVLRRYEEMLSGPLPAGAPPIAAGASLDLALQIRDRRDRAETGK